MRSLTRVNGFYRMRSRRPTVRILKNEKCLLCNLSNVMFCVHFTVNEIKLRFNFSSWMLKILSLLRINQIWIHLKVYITVWKWPTLWLFIFIWFSSAILRTSIQVVDSADFITRLSLFYQKYLETLWFTKIKYWYICNCSLQCLCYFFSFCGVCVWGGVCFL